MLNRVILIGRLTKDPELRYTPAGVAVTQFTLAIDRPFVNAEKEKEADFINIVVWRQLAETCANYLRKGRLTAVEGRMQTRNYDNNEGKKVYITEVVADNVRFLESSKDKDGNGGGNNQNQSQNNNQNNQSQNNNQSQGNHNQGQGNQNRNQGQGNNQNQGNQNRSQQGNNQGGYNQNQNQNQDPFYDDGKPIDISDDDLPF
jgi:single-strand DNA-binding protein